MRKLQKKRAEMTVFSPHAAATLFCRIETTYTLNIVSTVFCDAGKKPGKQLNYER